MNPCIFIADIHLDYYEKKRIRNFISFLDFIEEKNIPVYILGDLFNFWIGEAQAKLGIIRPLIRKCLRLSRLDLLFFLHGNRDFLFSHYWVRKGGIVIEDGKILRNSGQSLILYHGDILCTSDIRYRKYRAVVQKNRWLYYATRFLTPKACIEIGKKMRNISKKEICQKNTKEMQFDLDYIQNIVEENKVDFLICGHSHKEAIIRIPCKDKKALLYNLPENTGNKFRYLLWKNQILEFREFSP